MFRLNVFPVPPLRASLLFLSVLLSGCSTVSEVASDSASMLSGLNPFDSGKPAAEEQAKPVIVEAAPVLEVPESIKTENGGFVPVSLTNPASPQPGEVQATVGHNGQCTTFCALPLRKPPTAQ